MGEGDGEGKGEGKVEGRTGVDKEGDIDTNGDTFEDCYLLAFRAFSLACLCYYYNLLCFYLSL